MKRLSVVGLGYIGLPTAILASQNGYDVSGFDIDQNKIDKINNGDSTIVEPEITERLYNVIKDKKFKASSRLEKADCFLIAVPTPFKPISGQVSNATSHGIPEADLSYVFDAADKIAKVLLPGNLVILESTVPVGTTSKLAYFLEDKSGLNLGIDLFVAHCPERVLPGKIFKELLNNDRVIGGVCHSAAQMAKNFYSKFVKGQLYLMDDKAAEMVKLVENSSRDIQIALANQIDAMCKKVDINPYQVIEAANRHPRVNILNPSCGVGGHCIAVDPWFLIQSFPQDSKLLKTARNINDEKPYKIIKDIIKKIETLKEKTKEKVKVLVLGLTFKPDVDDMRQSPALKIARALNEKKDLLKLAVCEPNVVSDNLKKMEFSNVVGVLDGTEWADLVVILVKHKEFVSIKNLNLKNKVIVDTCGLFMDQSLLRRQGYGGQVGDGLLYETKEGLVVDGARKDSSNLQARI